FFAFRAAFSEEALLPHLQRCRHDGAEVSVGKGPRNDAAERGVRLFEDLPALGCKGPSLHGNPPRYQAPRPGFLACAPSVSSPAYDSRPGRLGKTPSPPPPGPPSRWRRQAQDLPVPCPAWWRGPCGEDRTRGPPLPQGAHTSVG